MNVPTHVDFVFTMSDVFPAGDPLARYVVRLSIGLGDIRLVADQLDRDNLTDRERVYFGRLLMAHMRELLLVLEPPPLTKRQREAGEPEPLQITDVIAALGKGKPDVVAMLETLWTNARTTLKARLELRPETTLWHELRRVRNRLLHYGYTTEADVALTQALETLACEEGLYEIRNAKWLDAKFADLVSVNLAFPMSEATRALEPQERQAREKAEAEELLAGVMDATEPLFSLLHNVEAVYFRSKPDAVTLRYGDGRTTTLGQASPNY